MTRARGSQIKPGRDVRVVHTVKSTNTALPVERRAQRVRTMAHQVQQAMGRQTVGATNLCSRCLHPVWDSLAQAVPDITAQPNVRPKRPDHPDRKDPFLHPMVGTSVVMEGPGLDGLGKAPKIEMVCSAWMEPNGRDPAGSRWMVLSTGLHYTNDHTRWEKLGLYPHMRRTVPGFKFRGNE